MRLIKRKRNPRRRSLMPANSHRVLSNKLKKMPRRTSRILRKLLRTPAKVNSDPVITLFKINQTF